MIPVGGGEPRQLTFHNDVGPLPPRGGVDNRVLGWTPDSENVVFLAHRLAWSNRLEVPYVVPVAGGMEHPLGPPRGGGGMLSPDGKTLVYTPKAREFRTWKRYHGGNAQDVWTFDLTDDRAHQLTDYDGTDNQPVWVGDTVYFTSDRAEGTLNLFAISPTAATGSAPRQVTHHKIWDVLWPSAGTERIVYQAGGWIWRYDPAMDQTMRVPIKVYGDFKGLVPRFADVSGNIDSAGISPSGARALFGARGDLYTVPAKKGEIRDLTRSQGVRERDPAWSPDGRQVAYWSDRTGEYELYVRPADGSGEERRVTTDGSEDPTWRYAPRWSPDGSKIAFGDREARLRIVDLASGALTDADRGRFSDITDYQWSPDNRWLTYTKVGSGQLPSVWVYSLDKGASYQLTGDDTAESEPTWDPKGRYLYFVSDRDYNLTFSSFEFAYVYTHPARVYVGLLTDKTPALFLPESDEEKPAETPPEGTSDAADKKGAKKGAEAKKATLHKASEAKGAPGRIEIDTTGFESRIRALPGGPDDYRGLAAVDSGVLYMEGMGPEAKLQLFDLDSREANTVLEGVQGFELAAGGKKLLYRAGGGSHATWGIADVRPGQKVADGKLDLSHLTMRIDPGAEWHEELVDAWRIWRDWYYDPKMNGLDWKAIRAKYEPLVDYVADRHDLDFIFGEMGGELSSGHVYVQPSDDEQLDRREGGLLGAEIAADPSGYFEITKIYPGQNWQEDYRSPLTEPGVHVAVGDLILAVDGVSTKTVKNFYQLLQDKADQVVTLKVAPPSGQGAAGKDAHDERVRTITHDTGLRYLDAVEAKRRYVEKASGGKIGYIHVEDTAVEGTRELYQGFYAQATKDALIIDDRYNGGGFIPNGLIDLLERPLMSYWARRDVQPFTTPGFVHRGPQAMLTNGYAGSGGDAFPYYFREQGLGPLIGTATWGGLIGLSGGPSLADGGSITAPSFRFLSPSGAWAVEGVGVKPDIKVVDRPDLEAKGIDPTLDKAIEVLMKKLEENPPKPLAVPTPPATAPKPESNSSGR